jgi:hypothetical protein
MGIVSISTIFQLYCGFQFYCAAVLEMNILIYCPNQTLEFIYIYIHLKIYQTVLELDFRAVKFLFFPRRDLNPHHCYTAAPFA